MEILDRTFERQWGYLSFTNSINGFYTKSCVYVLKARHKSGICLRAVFNHKSKWNGVLPYKVVLCRPVEQILRRVYGNYSRMIAKKNTLTRLWISITTDYKAMSGKGGNLFDSYIFKTYYNGFAGAYKEIHHYHTKELVSPQAFYEFSKSYILSDKIQSLYNEPSSDCCKLRPFRDFCIDLGRFCALLYTEAETARNNVDANTVLNKLADFKESSQTDEIPFLESIMLQLSKTNDLRSDNCNPVFLKPGLRGIIVPSNNSKESFSNAEIENLVKIAIKYVTTQISEETHKKDLTRSQKIASLLFFLKHAVDCEMLNIIIEKERKGKNGNLNIEAFLKVASNDFGNITDSEKRLIKAYYSETDSGAHHMPKGRKNDFESYYLEVKDKKQTD